MGKFTAILEDIDRVRTTQFRSDSERDAAEHLVMLGAVREVVAHLAQNEPMHTQART